MRGTIGRIGRWATLHPLAACLIWALWLSILYGMFGPHSYVRIFDNADGGLAARAGMNISISGWDAFSSWAHGWAGGVDRGVNDLDVAPFLVLPGWLAYWVVMFAQRLVGAYFGFRLARDRWNLSSSASWFLALWFSLFLQPSINGSWAGWTLYDGLGVAALPAVAWLLLSRDTPRWRLLVAAVGAGVLYAWTSIYALSGFVVVLLAVVLAISGGKARTRWLAFGVFVAAWVIAESPALLAGVMNSAASHRADRAAFSPLSPSLGTQALLALNLVRDNLVGIAIGVWAVARTRHRGTMWVLIVTAVAAVLVGLAQWGDSLLDAIGGPLAAFSVVRFYMWVPFLAAAAGALGLNALKVSGGRRAYLSAAVGLSLVLVLSLGVNLLMGVRTVTGSNYQAVLEDASLVTMRENSSGEEPFRVATVVAGNAGYGPPQPGFAWAQNLETVDGYLNLYPQRYQDFWERVIGPLIASDRQRYDYFHFWGNRVYLFSPIAGFTQKPVQVEKYYDLDLLALANVRYLVSGVPLQDVRLREVSRPGVEFDLGSKSLVTRNFDAFRSWLGQLTGSPAESTLYVYELQDTLPRAFVTGSIRVFSSENALLDSLSAASPKELSQTAFLLEGEGDAGQGDGGSGDVLSFARSSDRLEISVRCDSAALLVVTEQYSKFWKAKTDGASTSLLPADGPFMAVPVQAGLHKVELHYDAPYSPLS